MNTSPRATAPLRAYRGLMRALTLPLLGWLWWRGRREPAYRERLRERLGFIPVDPTPMGGLWLHAASVGEVQAARPLIEALLRDWPAHSLVVSTQTPTGAAALRAAWGDRITHRYAPLDTPGAVCRFLDRLRPQALVLIERELWPQWLFACAERALPVVLVNARLTEASAARYRRWQALMAHAWSGLRVAAADEATATRFAALGVAAERVAVAGNLKFDLAAGGDERPLPPDLQGRRLVVAGSTHEGDETAWLAAWPAIHARHPDAVLVLVPRHPQRFDAVSQALARASWPHARRSRGEALQPGQHVLLADTMGELMFWYRHAALCFVGGTLAPVGGHNPLEPLSLGQPVLFGPHTHNAPALFDEAAQRGAALRVADAAALEAAVVQALSFPETWARRGQAALALMADHRGATQRCLQALHAATGPVQPQRLVPIEHRTDADGRTVWFDPARTAALAPADFLPAPAAERLATGSGRGQAALVPAAAGAYVLRHYRRGGLVARLSDDRFLREPLARGRALREFALLRLMRSWDLPVPAPVAALHRPHGLVYSADIAVAWLPDTRNLVQCLREARPSPAQWAALGRAIRRLHERQVFHADLNAHNLLLGAQDTAWVVDFDKCAVRAGSGWKAANLARLQRSLRKEAQRQTPFHWHEDDWALLLAAYEPAPASERP
ncbi:MAG: 3-deoxy-D-manno-octulosonic acid kinase [Hydrogenophaga sp.]|uniref:3-deoxy-D-manno-octulosonic acid kinase n=1 Tax=Hydrogenophaga sp. TaxID=1904254 RepID=UPI00257EAECD|nr:3-deoxy-D-manno-octulosonic acid kinase [Hydrogenophaga sp.]MBL0944536.1 3-deoxy-D-manno-octulosonic acid kinase [Hydrogenophaga sp.]